MQPTIVVIHLGTNDLKTQDPDQFMCGLGNLVNHITEKYQCEILISEILPRKDKYSENVNVVNGMLHKYCPAGSIISHGTITNAHLHDQVHLNKFTHQGSKYSGVQLLARDIYRAIYKHEAKDCRLAQPPLTKGRG